MALDKSQQHIEATEPGETILASVKKHPFGLIKTYVIAIVGLVALIGFFYIMLLERIRNDASIYNLFIFSAIVIALLVVVILLVLTSIYYQTKFVVTDENLIIVQQKGLFSRSVSHIFLADIEDVSSSKQGIAPTFFNYGTLRVETESEQRNFILSYCPSVERISKVVLDAKENYISKQGNVNNKTISD